MKSVTFALLGSFVVLLSAGCGDEPKLSREELQDPNTCLSCHKTHHDQWSGSMHAYASTDPVFRAMHKRGQREDDSIGLLCVSCHAPMAVENGTITLANVKDFDFSTLPPTEDGVTCYFCHNVEKVTTDHNNGLVLANDQTMRGGLQNPIDSTAHHSKYDVLMDSERNKSEMCGSCHDVVMPNGVALERTFMEWKETIYGTTEDPAVKLTCGGCHLEPVTDVIADAPGVVSRPNGFHDHTMAGIDQALTPFPQQAEQAQAIADILPSIGIKSPRPLIGPAPGGICLNPNGDLTVRVDSFTVGHSFPSGVSHDRRVWLEVIAYDVNNQIVFQSGVVPNGMDPEEIGDPNLFGLWERTSKEDGSPAHFFHEVATIDPNPLHYLPGPVTLDPNDPRVDHSRMKTYAVTNIGAIEKITARVMMRALPFATLRLLEQSGDLDPSIKNQLKTLEVATSTWLKATQIPTTKCNPK
ncbi:MAG: uncharacterized protein JWP01_3273 [Myxococcales bacterium]|nr:uncharacterized protein [Myxococcales bacterium]